MREDFWPLITTTRKEKALDSIGAEDFKKIYGGLFVERKERSLEGLIAEFNPTSIVVFEEGFPTLYDPNQLSSPLRFHLNIGALRLQKVQNNGNDRFLEVSGIEAGMKVLDGTLGLGTDALLSAWAVGDTGKVVALEGSKAIFSIVDFSLHKIGQGGDDLLAELARRIEVKQIEFSAYSKVQETNTFDIVYLDPMFDKPRGKSIGIQPIRLWAFDQLLTAETAREAFRLCKRRMIIKEAKGSHCWEELSLDIPSTLTGKRYQSIRYRILDKESI